MALVALAIGLDSKGPVLFRQKRYGYNNRLIWVFKFRSMYTERTDANAERQTTRDDDRITRVGRFIRKTSIDELPAVQRARRQHVDGRPAPPRHRDQAAGIPFEAVGGLQLAPPGQARHHRLGADQRLPG